MVSANGLKNPARMMIGTGAGRNWIKLNIIENDVEINQNEILHLTGINNVPVYTLGQITLKIFGYPTIFNSIPNNVPVEEDGVLGSEFFIGNDVKINYISKCFKINNNKYLFKKPDTTILPAWSISTLFMWIKNENKKEGFITLLSLKKGIYEGNAIVKNHRGKAYIKVANILPVSVEIETPTAILEDFEEITINNYKTKTFRNKYASNNPEELIDKGPRGVCMQKLPLLVSGWY